MCENQQYSVYELNTIQFSYFSVLLYAVLMAGLCVHSRHIEYPDHQISEQNSDSCSRSMN